MNTEPATHLRSGSFRYRYLVVCDWCRNTLGRLLDLLRVPGLVREMSHGDKLTNSYISVKYSRLFTIVHVNGVDYYFRRLTGKFDGTGMSMVGPYARKSQ